MSLMRRPAGARLAPDGGTAAGPSGGPDGADATSCIRCGAPLPALARRRQNVCRVCATQQAQTYLRDALANRRRRPQPSPDGGPPPG
jgi:hypothetical protein